MNQIRPNPCQGMIDSGHAVAVFEEGGRKLVVTRQPAAASCASRGRQGRLWEGKYLHAAGKVDIVFRHPSHAACCNLSSCESGVPAHPSPQTGSIRVLFNTQHPAHSAVVRAVLPLI
jgi:hypothetical protein